MTPTSAGTPRASPRSARSPGSTGWRTGTRGRSRSSGSARSGRARTPTARRRAAELLEDGAIFAFGLSEKEHGADIYSTDMVLTPAGDGGFTASGSKYYIGNGNLAGMVSVFGRRADVEGPDGYVFFAADSGHPQYRLVKNVVNSQNFVSEFRLEEYPVGEEDILHTGKDAFHAALNTVNVGKFNLGLRVDRHLRARVLRGDHARGRPHPVRAQGDGVPARAAADDRRLHAAGGDEALRRPRDRLLPQRGARTTAATCCSTRSRR